MTWSVAALGAFGVFAVWIYKRDEFEALYKRIEIWAAKRKTARIRIRQETYGTDQEIFDRRWYATGSLRGGVA